MSDFKFSCPTCGQHISCDTSNVGMTVACPACNTALVVPPPPQAAPPAPPGLSIAASQARHTAAEASHSAEVMSRTHAQPTAPSSRAPGGGKTSGLAIASLVCSLTGCLGFIPGIICGHLARRNIRRDPSLKGGGLALAGLIISYLSLASCAFALVFGVSSIMAVFKSPEFKKAVADAQKQQLQTQANHASTTTNTSAPQESLWNLNLITAQFPDQPAAGKIHNLPFTVENATAQNGVITLHGDADSGIQVMIFTFMNGDEPFTGKNYDISPAGADAFTGKMPHIHMTWKNPDGSGTGSKAYPTGFALKLQLAAAADADGKIPGKIYVCLPDNEQSYVAGNFTLEVKKTAAAAKKKKKKPNAN
jgi:hypothetical protein